MRTTTAESSCGFGTKLDLVKWFLLCQVLKILLLMVCGPLNGLAGCAKKDNGESCCFPDYQNNLIWGNCYFNHLINFDASRIIYIIIASEEFAHTPSRILDVYSEHIFCANCNIFCLTNVYSLAPICKEINTKHQTFFPTTDRNLFKAHVSLTASCYSLWLPPH